MDLAEQFKSAQEDIQKLTERPSNDELLNIYALFKQATEGDNEEPEPGMFDIKAAFKWKKWTEKKGLSKEEAMQQYIDLVKELFSKYSHS